MTHRMAVEDFFLRRNISNQRPLGPTITQEELDAQKAEFFAAGGRIAQIPVGQSAYVIEYKAKPRREDKRVVRRLRDELDLEGAVGVAYVAELLGCSVTGVRDLMRKEEVPHFRYGRTLKFRKDEIEAWVERRAAE